MADMDLRHVKCRCCNRVNLTPREVIDQIIGYICESCNSSYDLEYMHGYDEKIVHVNLLRLNPDYSKGKSLNIIDNINEIQEIKIGEDEFYSNIYEIGKIKY